MLLFKVMLDAWSYHFSTKRKIIAYLWWPIKGGKVTFYDFWNLKKKHTFGNFVNMGTYLWLTELQRSHIRIFIGLISQIISVWPFCAHFLYLNWYFYFSFCFCTTITIVAANKCMHAQLFIIYILVKMGSLHLKTHLCFVKSKSVKRRTL